MDFDLNNQAARTDLAAMINKLFDHWELSEEDRAMLLGITGDSRETLRLFQENGCGESYEDLINRIGNLLSIHKSLRILYPKNREVVYKWMTVNNKDYNGSSPLETVRRDGLEGLICVRRHLDFMLQM